MPSKPSYPLYEKLWDGPKAKLIAEIDNTVLVITDSMRLYEDLRFFASCPVFHFPSWETLPSENISPSPDIIGRRFEILHTLLNTRGQKIVLAPLQAVLQPVPGKKTKFLEWSVGETISFDEIPAILEKLGYRRETVVADKGEFAVRGGIIDLYPVSSFDPYRIDFFGDEIEEIRTFDPIRQMSTGKAENLVISPAAESEEAYLMDYLDTPHVVFEDLLKIEDHFVALKDLDFDRFWGKVKERTYFSEHLLEELEMFNRPLQAKRIRHNFFPVQAPELLHEYKTVHIVASGEAETEAMRKIAPPNAIFHDGYLSSGFIRENTVYYPYSEYTGRHKVSRGKWRNTYQTPPSDFHELKPGDFVVHFHNGIGKFLGIETQTNHLGQETEFMAIEYAGGAKLFAPLAQSHLISRYIGSGEEAPQIHTLGTKNWQKAKVKAEKAIVGYAQDLIKWQAEREVTGGSIYPPDSHDMQMFEEEFPFVETMDQVNAIEEIKNDLTTEKAMDRLICGDVGYGKTEVAMRAAFKAVVDGGKQVAVLVPTTILAMQHYETIRERMASFPVRVGVLSRFVKPKEAKKTIEGVKSGSIDILIGTHRIVSKDIFFKNLGLIVIDEEQRFGVRAKEHLKRMKTGVDCITLSATPIPRTLYFSLVGAKDMSVINTPPQDRLPIRSILADRDPQLIKNAIERELSHDGQVYFIHNRVESIDRIANELAELVPIARIAVVHGQMPADRIDEIFHSFKTGETQILVATTIVESGVDIPNANTILIDRADTYGLADLYQLRGRVGRWNRPAFAYFLTPTNRELPEIARRRLTALIETSGFGGGMKLAMRDLEIRGAGDILGTKQSGHVTTIGFHLYCKLLKKAISALKKELSPDFTETKIEFTFDAAIPRTYIHEPSLRIELYHRLGDALTHTQTDDILKEIEDRFGKAPKQVILLYHLTRIRITAQAQKITFLKFQKHTLYMEQGKASKRVILKPTPSGELFEQEVTKELKKAFTN
ncbi:MAG: Transcription-repair-coupling factor [Chlamydiia bacterium]|nr:Transcription-repair-coupling factor [Chlamydiia bacterium]MCH9614966.1 Transcription-repair-coupling factor [Chlamydiia bacterium]MCH9629984.1 Transcription-repair-coupling factor [Chlamydiia bacterium]